jgi:hypothetical protein
MITRDDVLSKAAMDCLKDLYSKAQPKVDWEDFLQQNKDYTKKYNEWHLIYNQSMGNEPTLKEYCGLAPYEFYYLPKDIFKQIVDSYVHAYRLDVQRSLLDTIETLKNYCKEPIVDKYIEGKDDEPGHRGYDHPDSLHKELAAILRMYCDDSEADFEYVAQEVQSKFFEFLDMAGNFFNWNRDLNAFNMTVYLGASPCSNKERVIENWKQYRDKDIIIDESIYIEDEE